MKTRGIVTNYRVLAGINKQNKMSDKSDELDSTSQQDEIITLSSNDENDYDFVPIKQEPLSDNDSDIPLNVALSMKFAQSSQSLKNNKTKPKVSNTAIQQRKESNEPTCSKYLKKDLKGAIIQVDETSSDNNSSDTSFNHVKKLRSCIKKGRSYISSDSDCSSEPNSKKIKKESNKQVQNRPSATKNMKKLTSSKLAKKNTKGEKFNELKTKKYKTPEKHKYDSSDASSSEFSSSEENNSTDDVKERRNAMKKRRKHSYTYSDSDSDKESEEDFCKKKKKTKLKHHSKQMKVTTSEEENDSETDDDYGKKQKTKHNTSDDSTESDENEHDDFFGSLNDVTTKTSRNLEPKVPYKLLKLTVTNETGFNGTKYKKAVAKLQHSSSKKIVSIILPRPIANYNKKTLREMNKRMKKGKHPHYTVKKITTKKRPNQKGHYDLVDFKWS